MNDKFLKKIVFIMLFIGFGTPLFAQIQSAQLGVNGLTCSQCSRSVELKLNKLKFIQEITMDLEHTNATLTFKKNETVDLFAIAKAVRDAGFSVRILTISIDVNKIDLSKGCFMIKKDAFDIVGEIKVNKGKVNFQLIGKEFMSSSDWKSSIWGGSLMYRSPDCIGKNTYFIKYIE